MADAGLGRALRIERHRARGQYLDTFEVAAQAQELMLKYGWSKPAIVAHPYHMPRVDAICLGLGMDTIAPAGLEVVRFDAKSAQPWTRDSASCADHELAAIASDHAQGWL